MSGNVQESQSLIHVVMKTVSMGVTVPVTDQINEEASICKAFTSTTLRSLLSNPPTTPKKAVMLSLAMSLSAYV